jgi:hypothetical protein
MILYEIQEDLYNIKKLNNILYENKISCDLVLYENKIIMISDNISNGTNKIEIELENSNSTKSSDCVKKFSEIFNYLFEKFHKDREKIENHKDFSTKNKIKNKILSNKIIKDINIKIYEEASDFLFFGYTSHISKYSLPKHKDNFDKIPFIRTKNNEVYFLSDYDYNNENIKIICHLCVLNNEYFAIILQNNKTSYHKWKEFNENKSLKCQNYSKFFNYSGNNVNIFYKNKNITIKDNYCITLNTDKDDDCQSYVPTISNEIIRFGQNSNQYGKNISSLFISNNKKNKIKIQSVVFGYVNKNTPNMFPVRYDEIDNINESDKWSIAIRFNNENFFTDINEFSLVKCTDEFKISVDHNHSGKVDNDDITGLLKMIKTDIIYIKDEKEYIMTTLDNKHIHFDFGNMNYAFYNKINCDINIVYFFSHSSDEYKFTLKKNELVSILLESEKKLKINSLCNDNINSEFDIENTF